jgi:hypothetical protein
MFGVSAGNGKAETGANALVNMTLRVPGRRLPGAYRNLPSGGRQASKVLR